MSFDILPTELIEQILQHIESRSEFLDCAKIDARFAQVVTSLDSWSLQYHIDVKPWELSDESLEVLSKYCDTMSINEQGV